MPADGRQRGGHDGLVERAEEHRQHDAEHDRPDFRMRERRRLDLRRPGFCFGLGLRLASPSCLAERGWTAGSCLTGPDLDFGFGEVIVLGRQIVVRDGNSCWNRKGSLAATRSMPCRFPQCKTR